MLKYSLNPGSGAPILPVAEQDNPLKMDWSFSMTIFSRRMPEGFRRLAGMLSLVFLPALGSEGVAAVNRPPGVPQRARTEDEQLTEREGSRPYLTVASAPALRVREPTPAPIYDIEPAPAGPSYLDENSLPPAPQVAKDRMEGAQMGAAKSPGQQDRQRRRQEEEEVPTILPDDLRKDVRPEDVIPFFQFPGSSGPPSVSLPVPGQPPAPAQIPSSATYRQE